MGAGDNRCRALKNGEAEDGTIQNHDVDIDERSGESPVLVRVIASKASLVAIIIPVLGAISALIDLNPFWLFTSIGAISILLHLSAGHQSGHFLPWWFLIPMTLPFITLTVGVVFEIEPLEFTSTYSWLVSSVGLFCLCILLTILIDSWGAMHMDGVFFIVASFLLFESVVVIQGYVSWYSDLYLGTKLVPNSADFMVYYILATATGLVLSGLFNLFLKRGSFNRFKALMIGVE